MFTGLIEDLGAIRELRRGSDAVRLAVTTAIPAAELNLGESIAVDGICLTVTDIRADGFRADVSPETVERSTLGALGPGSRVNLERALRLGDRLGGHMVQGHVDGVGEVTAVEEAGETVFVRFRMPDEVARVTVVHGSVALDGVSLTVNGLDGRVAEVAIIPYTWEHTTMDRLAPGSRVNLEADLMGKYVERLMRPYLTGDDGPDGKDALS